MHLALYSRPFYPRLLVVSCSPMFCLALLLCLSLVSGGFQSIVTSTITAVQEGSTTTYTSYYTTEIVTETVHISGTTHYVTVYGDRETSTLAPSSSKSLQPTTSTATSSSRSTITSVLTSFETMQTSPDSLLAYSSTSSDKTCYFYFDLGKETTSTTTSTVYITMTQN